MPFSLTSVLAATAMLASAVTAKDGRTYAIVRHSGNPIVESRMDPIISPGQQSMHTHDVFGGTGFSTSMGTDSALNANGTTAVINGDKSNYWFPKLFFEAENGTLFPVKVTQVNTYYFFEATDDTIEAFPVGLRMLVGDPFRRTAPYTSTSVLDAVNGQDTIQPIQFTCPRADESTPLYVDNDEGRAVDPDNAGAGVGFPSRTCDAEGTGLRFDVHFPSCYNPAVDVADYASNTQYPSSANASGGGKQNCPEGWVHTPHLFLEAYYDQTPFVGQWTEGSGTVPWRLAPGDPTGFGLHADFISGWDTDDLQAMIDTCNAGFDGADKCPDLPSGVNTDQDVTITDPFANEIAWGMEELPGCNPIQYGPGEATVATSGCSATVSASGSASARVAASTTSGSSSKATTVASVATTSAATTSVAGTATTTTSSASSTSTSEDDGECEPDSIETATVIESVTSTVVASLTATATSTSNVTLPAGWKVLGCYKDSTSSRALTGIEFADIPSGITPMSCATYCGSKGYTVAGTEYGGQCFCGNSISTPTIDDSKCDMACSDGESMCGGSNALSVVTQSSNSRVMRR